MRILAAAQRVRSRTMTAEQLADALNAAGAQSTSVVSASDVAHCVRCLGGRLTALSWRLGPPTGGYAAATMCHSWWVLPRELAELPVSRRGCSW